MNVQPPVERDVGIFSVARLLVMNWICLFVMLLQGTVIIVANEGARIDIPDGSILEDKVVTGHLRILEH